MAYRWRQKNWRCVSEPAGAEFSLCTPRAPRSTYHQASPELTELGRGRSVNLASVGPALQAAG